VSLILLAACSVGEVPPVGGGPDGGIDNLGQQSFASTIAPLVTECTGCHATTQPPNLTSFAAMEAKYKTGPGTGNILVTKGALTAGVHQGVPYFTPAEQATVAAWIDSL